MSTFTKQVLKKIDIKIKCFFFFFYMKHNPVFRLLDKAAFFKKNFIVSGCFKNISSAENSLCIFLNNSLKSITEVLVYFSS